MLYLNSRQHSKIKPCPIPTNLTLNSESVSKFHLIIIMLCNAFDNDVCLSLNTRVIRLTVDVILSNILKPTRTINTHPNNLKDR